MFVRWYLPAGAVVRPSSSGTVASLSARSWWARTTSGMPPATVTSRSDVIALLAVSTRIVAPDSSRSALICAPPLPITAPTWWLPRHSLRLCVIAPAPLPLPPAIAIAEAADEAPTAIAVPAMPPAAAAAPAPPSRIWCSMRSSISCTARLIPSGAPKRVTSRSAPACAGSAIMTRQPDSSRIELMLLPPLPMIVPAFVLENHMSILMLSVVGAGALEPGLASAPAGASWPES
mmetsp:Transcript_43420/g.114100  ORF Transcript_43420/g.114100 Transcript_43420/m.114100 type:complete len:233 (-) Transcript_43420:100-798(-)